LKQALIGLFGCFLWVPAGRAGNGFPDDVEQALARAGGNRASLEKMLHRYRRSGDREKYRAACFLVRHMTWHSLGGHVVSYDAAVDSFRRAADSAYYALIAGTTALMQETDPLHRALVDSSRAAAERVKAYAFREPVVEPEELPDIATLDGRFLTKQIEHAFELRRRVDRVRRMPFADFCEQILPYRAIGGYPLVTGADELYGIFGKYLQADTARNYVALIERYNRALWWLRHFHGAYPFETTLGFPDLFFTGFHDCVDIAEYGAKILRACGVPAMVEYNQAYRIWSSRHFMVAIPDSLGRWMPFSPETEVPSSDYRGYRPCLNIVRLHFSRQENNPYSLRNAGEPLPEGMADPCMEDVSAGYMDVARLTLPLDAAVPAARKLVYLASFEPGNGLTAVTWGVRTARGFVFDCAVKDHLYFPAYCGDDGALRPFGTPFELHSDSLRPSEGRIVPLPRSAGVKVPVTLRRKYPRKPRLLRQAEAAVGTLVLGCDEPDFKQPDTLAVLTTVPEAEWTDLPLDVRRPYRYYRVKAPQADPYLHLAELQFLSRKSHGYANVMEPTPLDGGPARCDSVWDRLMDEPLDRCKWKAEYDGNVQTAPDRWPDVTLRLETPQWVERLRYVVKHADNGILPGDTYRLLKWGANGWEEVWVRQADTNRLDAGPLEVGALYWLCDISRGREELPFVVQTDGTVRFPHDWVIAFVEEGR